MSAERIERLERDLAEARERQTAADRVLEVIGRSASELEPVFETVLDQAVRLCGADAGLIHVLDEDVYRLAFAIGGSQAYRDYLAGVPIAPGSGTLVGRVGLERRTVQIPDVLADPDYEMHRARELGQFRTIVGVPMPADERVIGVITLWREQVAEFGERTLDLVTTFAAQAAIAIQNVQLFRKLEGAGRHKSEFLASMSHELRTPLNAVIGFSDVLLERMFGELNDRQEEYVRDISVSWRIGRHRRPPLLSSVARRKPTTSRASRPPSRRLPAGRASGRIHSSLLSAFGRVATRVWRDRGARCRGRDVPRSAFWPRLRSFEHWSREAGSGWWPGETRPRRRAGVVSRARRSPGDGQAARVGIPSPSRPGCEGDVRQPGAQPGGGPDQAGSGRRRRELRDDPELAADPASRTAIARRAVATAIQDESPFRALGDPWPAAAAGHAGQPGLLPFRWGDRHHRSPPAARRASSSRAGV